MDAYQLGIALTYVVQVAGIVAFVGVLLLVVKQQGQP